MTEYFDFPCDLCGSNEAIEIPNVREYTNGQVLHICKKCGLIHAKKRRSAQQVADTWTNQIFGDPKVLSPLSYSARNPHVKARQTYLAEFIDTHVGMKGKKLVDIGAGEGQFLEMARQLGANVFGVEPSPKNCVIMKQNNINFFEGTVEQYHEHLRKTNSANSAEICTMMFTLECTQNPRAMLNATYELLNEGGHVAIGTGSRILVPFKKPLHNFLSSSPVDTHPIHLSFNTLRGLLATCGFEVTHFNPYVENDNLTVLARKVPKTQKIEWKPDDYLRVADFFERWHKESLYYR